MIFAVLGQMLVGWLLADLLGGLFHWWEDRVGRLDMPLVGRWVIAPNRLHHRDAMAFMRKSLLMRNWTALPAVAAISLAWIAFFGPSVVWLSLTLGGALAVEVHYQAHLPRTTGPRLRWLLRPLWDIGIVQSPAAHNLHHRTGDRAYCPLTGWLNPLLDAFDVWARLEAGLTLIGLPPNRGTR
jgi:hypothetical protein